MKHIIIAKSGKNALTATDPNDFIFHSLYNTFKIIAQGTSSPTLAAGTDSHSVAHGQSIKPFVFGFCKYSGGFSVSPPGAKARSADFWFARLQIDSSNIYFHYVNNTGGNYTPTFKYIICESPVPADS